MQFSKSRVWLGLFLMAAAYFLVRAPWRALHDSGDFLTVFVAARCWTHHMDPYASANLVISARSAGAEVSQAQFNTTPSVYLPGALLLLSPFAILPWMLAKVIWLSCLLAASAWAAVALSRTAKRWNAVAWSFLLAFAPLQTGISKGQPSVLACALIIISIATPNSYIAGILLGTAACIKPQLVVGFLLLAVALRQGKKFILAGITGLAVTAAATALMKRGSVITLISNLSATTSASGINSGSALNPLSYQLINVDTIIPQSASFTPVVVALYAIIILASALAVIRAADPQLAAAVVASGTLLVGYHRFYDAELLWLGIPAMLLVAQEPTLWVLRVGYAAFLIPGQTLAATWLRPRTNAAWSTIFLHDETLACIAVWLIYTGTAISPGLGRKRAGLGTDLSG